MYVNSKIGGDIHQGDLIAVANGNDFTVGIYFGRGLGGTVQYYHPSTARWVKERYDRMTEVQKEKNPLRLGSFWKSFVNTPRDTRIMKLHRESIINQQMIDDILLSKEMLAQFNITVNF